MPDYLSMLSTTEKMELYIDQKIWEEDHLTDGEVGKVSNSNICLINLWLDILFEGFLSDLAPWKLLERFDDSSFAIYELRVEETSARLDTIEVITKLERSLLFILDKKIDNVMRLSAKLIHPEFICNFPKINDSESIMLLDLLDFQSKLEMALSVISCHEELSKAGIIIFVSKKKQHDSMIFL